jgi:hypothetical protein
MDINDWVGAIVGDKLHVVRRTGAAANNYEHRIYNITADSWTTAGPIVGESHKEGAGLFLAPYAGGLALFAIRNDNGNTVRYALWDGTNWSGWQTLVAGGGPARGFIAGYVPPAGDKPVVIWTQQSASTTYDIVGAKLP